MKLQEIFKTAGFTDEEIDTLLEEKQQLDPDSALFHFDEGQIRFLPKSQAESGQKGQFEAPVPDPGQFRAHLFLVLDQLPRGIETLRSMNIPEDIISATFSDIAVWYRHYHTQLGMPGLSPEILHWLERHLQGKIFRLGRLQYEPAAMTLETPLLPLNTPVLSLHIPEDGRLDIPAVEHSMHMAERFFEKRYPFEAFIIISWFFDHRFLELLPESSNMKKFAAMFTPIPVEHTPDREIYRRILGERAVQPHAEPVIPLTSLQKTIYPYYKKNILFGEGAGIILKGLKGPDVI